MPVPPPFPPAPEHSDVDRAALAWFVRELRGLSSQERAARDAWLGSHPDHPAALERWRQDWTGFDRLPSTSLSQIRQNLQRDKHLQARRAGLLTLGGETVGIKRRHALALAGTTLGVSALGLLTWQHVHRPTWQQSFASRRGQLLSLELPDGSRVQIDTQTRLEVVFFRKRREVHLLGGQAAFQVTSDIARPFQVWAGDARVTVVGTRFSVRHTPEIQERAGVQVAVSEGQVHVQVSADRGPAAHRAVSHPATDETAVDLVAGQQVSSDGLGRLMAVAGIDPEEVAAWRRQRVSFNDVTLAQAIAEFERYGDTRLRIVSDDIAALRITGTFNAQDLTNFRQTLPQVLPVRLLARADGWIDIAPHS